tara:strand:- start:996 stop:1373 length:378 start_codon:yes stop_codon:yes gene_type:complete
MAQFSVHVNKNDIRKFNRTMFMLKNFASNEFTKSVQTVASNIVGMAKMRSPVDTGALRQSITTDSKRIGPYLIEAAVVAEMDYAGYVEFGTFKQKPQPYFFNSVRDGLRHFNKDIQIKIKKISTR